MMRIYQAVSVSLGSRRRDKKTEIDVLGRRVSVWREGHDGDVAAVTARFTELDGRVDALGVGGIDLWLHTDRGRYKLHAAHKLVRRVRRTPVVDGSGLKNTLERGVVTAVARAFGLDAANGNVLLPAAIDRWGMTQAFFNNGNPIICGELGFALGVPIPIRSRSGLRRMAKWLLPFVTRLPIRMIYPTGSAQHETVPRFGDWYAWADIIAGDCLYIRRHMPADLGGKIIVTNTTTAADRAQFFERGVRGIITTTPVVDGRSFGTNLLEAALTAVVGRERPLSVAEMETAVAEMGLRPEVVTA